MAKRKPKVLTKMRFAVVLIVLVGVVAAVVVVTRPKALTFRLTDAVGDADNLLSSFDIVEIRLVKENNSLILTMETSENIPTRLPKYEMPEFYFGFLIDVDKDNLEDFTVTINIDLSGLSVSLGDKKLSYEHLGPVIKITIPLAEIGDLESFNLRAYSYFRSWVGLFIDTVPDVGWAKVSLT